MRIIHVILHLARHLTWLPYVSTSNLRYNYAHEIRSDNLPTSIPSIFLC